MPRSAVERYGIEKALAALKWVDEQYGDRLGEITTRLLGDLSSDPQYAQTIYEQLGTSETGRELLYKIDWPRLWPSTTRTVSPQISNWLRSAGLAFNPFGSEVAELDPRLPWYVIDTVYEGVRGPDPTILLGAAGTGKTAAALMLAYDCSHPPANPREAGAFPVYHRLRTISRSSCETSTSMAPLARSTARELLRYLWLKPEVFFELPVYKQDTLRLFFTLAYSDSTALLSAETNRLPSSLKNLLAPVSLSETVPAASSVSDQDWMDLLGDTLPVGFDRYHWLVDIHDLGTRKVGSSMERELSRNTFLATLQQITDSHFDREDMRMMCFHLGIDFDNLPAEGKGHKARELIKFLERRGRIMELVKYVEQQRPAILDELETINEALSSFGPEALEPWLIERIPEEPFETLTQTIKSLLDLAMPLTLAGVYLKLFVPIEFRSMLDDLSWINVMRLVWWEEDLKQMVNDRIRQTGGDSLMALCGPDVASDFETRFIQAAQGSPRQLIRLGNALLATAARHYTRPQLTEEDLEEALRSLGTRSLE
jgi:hypothetical protein